MVDSFFLKNPYPIEFYQFASENEPQITHSSSPKFYEYGYAAQLIKRTLVHSGFKQTSKDVKANLIVGSEMWRESHVSLTSSNRFNHLSASVSLGSKIGYHKLMSNLKERCGKWPDFYPETYLNPQQRDDLRKNFSSSNIWIQKPVSGSRGRGISIVRDFKNVSGRVVVQRYVDRPLLINQLKFDLRFYVFVASVNPLRVYVYNNGLVRFATQEYHVDNENLAVHLTNFSINKQTDDFVVTNDVSLDGTGSKWSHAPFWPYLEGKGFNIAQMKNDIYSGFATVIISAREFFDKNVSRNCFELYGFDVLVNENGGFSILEVNVSPGLGTSSQLDLAIKAPLVKDLFNLGLIPVESSQLDAVEDLIGNGSDSAEYAFVFEYEIAQQRCGGFTCIYPTKERIETHTPLLEEPTKFDFALNTWIQMPEDAKLGWLEERYPKFIDEVQSIVAQFEQDEK